MDHMAFDTSISTQMVLAVTLAVLTVLVTFVNMIVWMVTRLITGRNDMLKYCQAGIVFANLIAATFCLPAQLLYISFGYWAFGMPQCVLTITVGAVIFVTVTWLVTVLVMDRVLKSTFKDVYLTLRKKYSRAFHLLMWAILLVLTLPFFLVHFLNPSYKLDNDGARFHCHVPFHASTALFLIVFGFAGPIVIAGVMMTLLWMKITKRRLMRRKKISVLNGYSGKSDSRAMTPWGKNWLNNIENKVRMGRNNGLPSLRRHSIGEYEPETNEDLPQVVGRDRRNSLPESTSESHTASQEQIRRVSQSNLMSQENGWHKVALALAKTGIVIGQTPSLNQKQTGKCFNGIANELSAKGKPNNIAQYKQFCETKNPSKKMSQHRVLYDLASANQSNEYKNPWQSISVAQFNDPLSLPGTVHTDEVVEQTAEMKLNGNGENSVSLPRKDNIQHQSKLSFMDDMEQLSEYHLKTNQWVRGSRMDNELQLSYDDDSDDDDDDDDDDDEGVRVNKILTIMIGLNVVLWLPILCVYCRQTFCDSCQVNLAVWTVLKILGQISLITNPVCLLLVNKHWKPLLKYVLSGFGVFSCRCLQRW